ncbi:unnamed protein product [Vitrella brassicaformis CCMP3155]|uniref:Uncharacterized protein n=1 Tax=Vitrella brassicaformis (strain CCMP3155) TaxID=1169540 RepID=A0A0G4GUY3_VITBC|nr:unnamed protein product [Vitrella brassicaformis CCMP3155]|eukprot:CEM34708.1 unnamed protein product [Vitrella brassicaformis CCMP3155]
MGHLLLHSQVAFTDSCSSSEAITFVNSFANALIEADAQTLFVPVVEKATMALCHQADGGGEGGEGMSSRDLVVDALVLCSLKHKAIMDRLFRTLTNVLKLVPADDVRASAAKILTRLLWNLTNETVVSVTDAGQRDEAVRVALPLLFDLLSVEAVADTRVEVIRALESHYKATAEQPPSDEHSKAYQRQVTIRVSKSCELDPHKHVRLAAVKALTTILMLLSREEYSTARAAAVLQMIISRLYDKDGSVRKEAAKLLTLELTSTKAMSDLVSNNQAVAREYAHALGMMDSDPLPAMRKARDKLMVGYLLGSHDDGSIKGDSEVLEVCRRMQQLGQVPPDVLTTVSCALFGSREGDGEQAGDNDEGENGMDLDDA